MRAKLVLAIIAGLTMTVGLGTVLAGPKAKRPEARLADLRLTLALSEGTVAQGDVVPLRVTLTHEGKRPVKARWMCTCAPKNPGQDFEFFVFEVRRGGVVRTVPAVDPTATVACRKCSTLYADLDVGQASHFDWVLDLSRLELPSRGPVEIQVRYLPRGESAPGLASGTVTITPPTPPALDATAPAI